MSDYTVHLDSKVKSPSSHFRDMQVRRNAIESDRARLQTQRIQLMGKHTDLLKRVSLLTSSQETLKRLVDELSKDGIIALESMFSDALKTVFDDRNYSMKIEISERGNNKTADFILVENVNGVSLETNVRILS